MRDPYLQNLTFVEWSIYEDATGADFDFDFVNAPAGAKSRKEVARNAESKEA